MDKDFEDTRVALKENEEVVYKSDDSRTRSVYRIKSVIGKGGFSIIYRAEREGYTDVLLKELFPVENYERCSEGKIRPTSSSGQELKHFIKNLLREYCIGEKVTDEVASTSAIGKPFIAKNGNIYAEMSKSQPCVNLQAVLDSPRSKEIGLLAWNELIWQFTDIIGNIHNNRNILHLDLSPNNVIINGSYSVDETIDNIKKLGLTEHGNSGVWVVDFGSSADISIPSEGKAVIRGSSPGTAPYKAPELKGKPREAYVTSDIFSICMIYKSCVKHILDSDDESIPSTARAQLKRIISVGTDGNFSFRWQNTNVLIDQLVELRQRLRYKGISKAAIWEAAKIKAQYNLNYDPIKELLPSGQRSARLTEYGHLKDGASRRIEELIEETDGNTYLIGEGGIGKSTTLIQYAHDVFKKDYDEEKSVVPIYIELAKCTMSGASKNSNLINRYILNMLRSNELNHGHPTNSSVTQLEGIDEDQIPMLDALFNGAQKEQNNTITEFILMLDGLNEVSDSKVKTEVSDDKFKKMDGSHEYSIVRILVNEINELAKCPNVKIILTSRNDNEAMSDSSYQRIYITGLNKEEVIDYLDGSDIKAEKREKAKTNDPLMEILRIPLFLIIYTAVADSLKDTADITTRGELLYAFLSDAQGIYTENESGDKSVYTQIRRIKQLDNLPMDNDVQYVFILNYILPYICWHMVMGDKSNDYRQTMELDKSTLCNLIKAALDENCPFYAGYSASAKPREDARSFDEYDVKGSSKSERILFALTDTLGIFYKKGENVDIQETIFKIIHQHYRDYFAAVYMCRLMESARSSMARKRPKDEALEILREICERVVSPDVLVFTGEVLGEHRNSPMLGEDRKWHYNVPDLASEEPQDRMQTLIKRTLDVFREMFGKEVSYGVYNLIEILKRVRKDLSGADLHELDLSNITFNGVDLGEHGGGANMRGTKIMRENLFPIGHTDAIVFVTYSPDGQHIVTTSNDKTAKVWDATTGLLVNTLIGHTEAVIAAVYSQDGLFIVTMSRDLSVKIWDSNTGLLLKSFNGNGDVITTISYSSNGVRVFTISGEGKTRIWDAISGMLLLELEGFHNIIVTAVYRKDANQFITVSQNHTAQIWDANTGLLVSSLTDKINHHVIYAEYSSSEKTIFIVSQNNSIIVWDIETDLPVNMIKGISPNVKYAAFSPNGDYCVTTSNDNNIVLLWNLKTGLQIGTLKGHSSSINHVIFSPKGQYIVTVSNDKTTKIWDASRKSLLLSLERMTVNINSIAFNPNGSSFVLASNDDTARVWDAYTMTLRLILDGHNHVVNSAQYDSKGKRIITASQDKTAKVWNENNGELLMTLHGHSDSVNYATFSPNDKCIFTASDDNTAKEWDTIDGSVRLSIEYGPKSHGVKYAVYSFDEKHIMVFYNNIIYRWDINMGSLMSSIPHRLYTYRECINDTNNHYSRKRLLRERWGSSYHKDRSRSVGYVASYDTDGNQINKYCIDKHSTIRRATIRGMSVRVVIETLSVLCSREGKYIITNDKCTTQHNNYLGRMISVWDSTTGRFITYLKCSEFVHYAILSPDGKKIITLSFENNNIKEWDIRNGELLMTITGHSSKVVSAVYSPKGDYIITVSSDGNARVYDTYGKCLGILPNIPGLRVMGVDLRDLAKDSNLSNEDKNILRRYGAII